MTSSRYCDRERTGEQTEQRRVFINLAGYFSFHRKESMRIRIEVYDIIYG